MNGTWPSPRKEIPASGVRDREDGRTIRERVRRQREIWGQPAKGAKVR